MTDENVSGNESDGMETEVEERSSVPTKEIRKWLGAPEDLYEQLEMYYRNLLIERDALELLVQKQIEHLNKINLLLMATEDTLEMAGNPDHIQKQLWKNYALETTFAFSAK